MIHVYLSAKTSTIKSFHVVRAVKNSIRWRKQNSMKRIVATEKLQELNLQSQSEFSGALRCRRSGHGAALSVRDTYVPIPRHRTTSPGHFRDGERCHAIATVRIALDSCGMSIAPSIITKP